MNKTIQANEEIIELQKNRDTVQKRLNENSDPFFQYGYVRQLEDIDKKIEALQQAKNSPSPSN